MKHFQANDRLFFRKNWTCRNRTTRTVNSELHATICLPVVFQEIKKSNYQRRITLHHDNATSHTSTLTTAFLNTQNTNLMSHPRYSSLLAPNDFFLFLYLKSKMRGLRFLTPEEAVDAFWRYLNQSDKSASTIGITYIILVLEYFKIKRFSMINICFCSLIPKYKRQQ